MLSGLWFAGSLRYAWDPFAMFKDKERATSMANVPHVIESVMF